jgi:hypothetical protein
MEAISYWPGTVITRAWWHCLRRDIFLTEAKKAVFEVNQNILDKHYAYHQQKVKIIFNEEWYILG